MSLLTRAEQALSTHFEQAAGVGAPPRLVAAMRHAVFSGGARIRPQLCMAVATACGDDTPELTNAAAVALELMHCASLVHDDMPAFDNADTRRGLPTVHKAFSEPLALLAGDGLFVRARLPWVEIKSAQGIPYYLAEEYHQRYLAKNPNGYDCHSSTGVSFPSQVSS